MHYVLDACALLVIFNGEPEARKVLDLLEQAETGSVRLSIIDTISHTVGEQKVPGTFFFSPSYLSVLCVFASLRLGVGSSPVSPCEAFIPYSA